MVLSLNDGPVECSKADPFESVRLKLGHTNVYFLLQKLTLNSQMLLCNTFPGTMSEKGGMVGGVNCKSGMIYGKFVLLQNAYLSADLSLAEVVVYGTREGKAADMSSIQCVSVNDRLHKPSA